MTIMTAFFARKKKYNALLKVFKNSMRAIMPKVKFRLLKIKKPENIDHKRDTAFAFIAAAKYALAHNKGILAVADCDLMFLQSIEDINRLQFDIAVTTRNKMKYNTGLWFMKPTARAKKFIERWIFNTEIIMNNFCKYEDFCWQHGGIDQASLFMTLQKNKKASVLELPCQIWNATQSEWRNVDYNTRVIHIKSKLRLAVFGKLTVDKEGEFNYLLPLIKKWRSFLSVNA